MNTCLKAVRKARVASGETVLVIGQGPIGMLLMILAKYEGAEVYTSDPMPGRRAASLQFGAKEVFDPTSANLLEELRKRTGGTGRGRGDAGRAQPVIGPGSSGTRAAGRSRATVCS